MEKTGTQDKIDACEALVTPLLSHTKRYGHYAFDSICQQNNIAVHRKNDNSLPFRGRFQWTQNGDPKIEIRADQNIERERFTFAHELGHWLIHKTLPDKKKETLFPGLAFCQNEHDEEEKLADLIASELLMPRKRMNLIPQNSEQFRKQCIEFGVAKHDLIKRHAMIGKRAASVVHIMPALPDNESAFATVDNACLVTDQGDVFEGRNAVSLENGLRFCEIPDGSDVQLTLCCNNQTTVWTGFTYFHPGLLPETVFVSFHKN